MQKSPNWHLVAVLGHAARCLRGDVLRDGHGGHSLQRRRVRSGEAAAHALVDGTIPGEATVLCQCALLTAHCRKSIRSLKSKAIAERAQVTHVRLKAQSAIMEWQELRGKHFCNLLRNSYCLIWESWGRIQQHTEGKTTEEMLQLISPSPLLVPITETKESRSKPVSLNQEEVKRRISPCWARSLPSFSLCRAPIFLLSASSEVRAHSRVHLYQLLAGVWRLSELNLLMLSLTFRFATFPFMQ